MSGVDPKGAFAAGGPQRLFGTYPARVVDVADPHQQGRVKIELPWVAEDEGRVATAWARLATLMAGADRGTWFIPEVDDEVLVSFMAGDPRHPVVIGALWNGADAPPETMDGAGANHLRSVTSRAGHKLTFDDTPGAGKVEVETAGGHVLTLDDGAMEIKVTHSGGASVTIDAAGNVKVEALAQVEINAPAGLKVSAAMVTVDAGLSKFSGVVQADTVITNTVVSSTYTPGAGNVW